jgi:hypothetical protein
LLAHHSRPQLRLEQRREKIEATGPNKNPDALLRWVTLVRGQRYVSALRRGLAAAP